MRPTLVLSAMLFVAGSMPAAASSCQGVVKEDTCNFGGECPDGPTWRKGDKVDLMAKTKEHGQAVFEIYREGAIDASKVVLSKGCGLKSY